MFELEIYWSGRKGSKKFAQVDSFLSFDLIRKNDACLAESTSVAVEIFSGRDLSSLATNLTRESSVEKQDYRYQFYFPYLNWLQY